MRSRTRHVLAALLLAGAVAALRPLGILGDDPHSAADPAGQQGANLSSQGTYHQPAVNADLEELLTDVGVVDTRPSVPGYDRDCGTGHACSFGQAWSDDVEVALGHNGCDTRNDMLRSTLRNVEIRPGTNGCVVEAGSFRDPYTGQRIDFTKAEAYKVQIDHVYPLARAWDMGANFWSIQKRTAFANDPRNLVVADGPANASKSDQGPGEWLPVNASYRCTYLARYLDVAYVYELPITRTDHQAATELAQQCSTESKKLTKGTRHDAPASPIPDR